jgi:WD40 repeat protein
VPAFRFEPHGDALPPGAVARLGHIRLQPSGLVKAIAFSPNGKTLASASLDGENTICLWDRTTGKETRRIRCHSPCSRLAWLKSGKQLVVACEGWVHLLDITTAKTIRSIPIPSPLSPPFIADSGRYLAHEGKFDGDRVSVINIFTGKTISSVGDGLNGNVFALSPDGKHLVISGRKGQLCRLWNVRTSKEVRAFGSPKETTTALAFTPDRKLVAQAVDEHKEIRFYDVKTGRVARRLKGYQRRISLFCFSANGKRMAAFADMQLKCPLRFILGSPFKAASTNTLSFWDLESGKLHGSIGFEDAPGMLESLTFSPDGKIVAAGGGDRLDPNNRGAYNFGIS